MDDSDIATVKLFREDQVVKIMGLMDDLNIGGGGDVSQVVADMLAASVLGATLLGWEVPDMFSIIAEQSKMAEKLVSYYEG